jgi:predicted amidohydrolase YtcJ
METFKDGNPDMARRVWNTTGYGSPLLWMVGLSFSADGSYPDACTTLPTVRKHLEDCKMVPGNLQWETAFEAIKRGFRIAGSHAAGDLSADYMLTLIEMASAAGGLTLDDIRAKRHVLDHCSQNPRPDQIERGKRLGVSFACGPKFIVRAPRVAELYGREAIEKLAVPAKSLVDAGLRPAFHTDGHHGGPMAFKYLELLVTRKDLNGRVWGAAEAVDRQTALLMATRWGAEYVLREQDLGSLEPGKWADLMVVDRDYLTVPIEQLGETRVLLTLVGGRTAFAAPPFLGDDRTTVVRP